MSNKFYDVNITGAALRMSEMFESEYDEEEGASDNFNELILGALSKAGYPDLILEKINASIEYWLCDGQDEEDIYSSEGYLKDYDDFM